MRRMIIIILPEIAELELADRQNAPKRTWKITGEIQGKSPSKVKILSGLVINSKQDLMEEWRKYFANLLHVPPVSLAANIPLAITLMSIRHNTNVNIAKLYNRLLLNRIRDPLEKILHVNQAGFVLGRGCVEQIHLLHRILEGIP